MMMLLSQEILVIEANVSAPMIIGKIGNGVRRYIPIVGGRFTGTVSGTVLPGVDWQTVLDDGTIELSAHYALETVQGDRIELTSTGLRTGTPEVMERLARSEPVDPTEYYFRTNIRFRTSSARLARLNKIIAMACGERRASCVRLRVFEIL
jgi:hypothetical protein